LTRELSVLWIGQLPRFRGSAEQRPRSASRSLEARGEPPPRRVEPTEAAVAALQLRNGTVLTGVGPGAPAPEFIGAFEEGVTICMQARGRNDEGVRRRARLKVAAPLAAAAALPHPAPTSSTLRLSNVPLPSTSTFHSPPLTPLHPSNPPTSTFPGLDGPLSRRPGRVGRPRLGRKGGTAPPRRSSLVLPEEARVVGR